MTSRQKTWTLGGIALILCGVIGVIQISFPADPGLVWLDPLNALLYAVALLLFAFGLTRSASLVERKPLGTTALVVLGLWPLVSFGIQQWLFQTQAGNDGWMMFGYIAIALPTAAAIIATMQIARAGVVPGRWRWVPVGAFALYALAWTVPQILNFSAGMFATQGMIGVVTVLALLAFIAGTVGLGVCALIVAARHPARELENA